MPGVAGPADSDPGRKSWRHGLGSSPRTSRKLALGQNSADCPRCRSEAPVPQCCSCRSGPVRCRRCLGCWCWIPSTWERNDLLVRFWMGKPLHTQMLVWAKTKKNQKQDDFQNYDVLSVKLKTHRNSSWKGYLAQIKSCILTHFQLIMPRKWLNNWPMNLFCTDHFLHKLLPLLYH